MKQKRTSFSLAALLYALTPGLVLAAQATLQPLKGSVHIQHPASDQWEIVSQEMRVSEGDRLRTDSDSRAFLITGDDHRIAIGPDTHLTLSHLEEGKTKLYLASGMVRQKVRKIHVELGDYYKIQTPTAVCAVRGTDFSTLVNSVDKITTLKTFEGAVSFGKDELHAILVQMGEGASAQSGGKEVQIQKETLPAQEPAAPPQGSEGKPSDEGQGPEGQGPKGPPPPGGGPGGQGNWWDHPGQGTDNLFSGSPDQPNEKGKGPQSGQPGPHRPGGWKEGHGFGPGQGPNGPGNNNTYGGYGTGTSGQGSGGTGQGFEALIDTMRANSLHEQANSILVADLFQRRAVATDPLTGQYRQYADAVASMGTNGIRFLSATMVAGQPQTLSMDMVRMTFNQNLPAIYTDATKTAFYSAATPTYWVTDYLRDMTNTVDHVLINLNNGTSVAGSSGYATKFAGGSTKIIYPGGQDTLWTIGNTGTTYLGGAAPDQLLVQPGGANTEVRNIYHNTGAGDLIYSVRNTFSEPGGRIANLSTIPSNMSANEYLSGLNMRSTIFCNRFAKGRIDLFGSAQGRLLAGLFSMTGDTDARSILDGGRLREAPNGLDPT